MVNESFIKDVSSLGMEGQYNKSLTPKFKERGKKSAYTKVIQSKIKTLSLTIYIIPEHQYRFDWNINWWFLNNKLDILDMVYTDMSDEPKAIVVSHNEIYIVLNRLIGFHQYPIYNFIYRLNRSTKHYFETMK